MISIYDLASLEAAPLRRLDPRLRDLLTSRMEALTPELLEMTHFAAIEPGDTEADIVAEVGFTPLADPIDGLRFGTPGFEPWWAWLRRHSCAFEMIHTAGNDGFAYVLLIPDDPGVLSDLTALCRFYADREDEA